MSNMSCIGVYGLVGKPQFSLFYTYATMATKVRNGNLAIIATTTSFLPNVPSSNYAGAASFLLPFLPNVSDLNYACYALFFLWLIL